MPPSGSPILWFRKHLRWSQRPQEWMERLSLVALAAMAVLLWQYSANLSALQLAMGWGLLLLGVAVLSRHGWLRLFGPVLFFDLVRTGRRNRYFLFRAVYALVLLGVLCWVYVQFRNTSGWQRMLFNLPPRPGVYNLPMGSDWGAWGGQLTGREGARLAEWFFYAMLGLQLAAVLVLTPAYAAGAVAEEKERKTLEFLLATDIHSREIVLSKLASRLLQLVMVVMAGLPILGFTQFLGGIDPNLVLAGFAATGLTMVSVASFSILCSILARSVRDAIVLAYLGLAFYLGISFAVVEVWPPATAPLGTWVYAGNPFAAAQQLRDDVAANRNLAGSIPGILKSFAVFHGATAVLFILFSMARVRAIGLRHMQRPAVAGKVISTWRQAVRPRVPRLPMLWKEIFVEPGFRLSVPGRIVVGLVVLASLAPAVWIAVESLRLTPGRGFWDPSRSRWYPSRDDYLVTQLNEWVRLVGSGVACLLLVAVAVRAAGRVTGERDKQTLDGLLLSPLQSYDILFAKWLGSLLSIRWGFVWLGLIWAVGLASGALHVGGLILTLIAFLVYASTLAGLGLWFSTACRTTLRATMWTLGVTALLSGGHWVLWLCCLPLGTGSSQIASLLTPPAVLSRMSASVSEFGRSNDWEVRAILSMFGLFLWSLLAVTVWTITTNRFRRISLRMPYRRPDSERGIG